MKTNVVPLLVVILVCVYGALPLSISKRYTSEGGRGQLSLTEAQKTIIVDEHNKLRQSRGAWHMQTMVWDSTVAAQAVEWADCTAEKWFKHNSDDNPYGENLYASFSSMSLETSLTVENEEYNLFHRALKAWFDEEQHYNYNTNECAANKVCGHYTQAVWANSAKVGCGYAMDCSQSNWPASFYLVCNYDPPGNYFNEKPYLTNASIYDENETEQSGEDESDRPVVSMQQELAALMQTFKGLLATDDTVKNKLNNGENVILRSNDTCSVCCIVCHGNSTQARCQSC